MGKDPYFADEDMSDESFGDYESEDDLLFNENAEKFSDDYGYDYNESSYDEFDNERYD